MHILPPAHRSSPLFLAALALLVLGLSLSFLAWQNLRQQKIAVERHMLLAAESIASGLEGNMSWGMRHFRGMSPARPLAGSFFEELTSSQDVLFAGVFGPGGEVLLAPEDATGLPPVPQDGLAALRRDGQWHAFLTHGGRPVLLFARRTRPLLARHFLDPPAAMRQARPTRDAMPFLVLALDMSQHLAMYHDARRAAVWQTGYVLATATLLLLASLALLRRREQGRRVTELEMFQSRLLDNLPDGLLTLGRDRDIRSANPAAENIFGEGRTLAGMRWDDLPLSRVHEETAHSGEGLTWSQYVHGARFLEILSLPLREEGGSSGQTLVLVRDRTRIRDLEAGLQEAQRLAAIGRLAAAVAHEIRNPLSALRGFAQFFASKLAGKEPEQTYARTMLSEADRLNRVITDLLFLSRQRTPDRRDVPLEDLFSDMSNLVGLDLQKHQAAMRPELDVASVWADPDLLRQAMLNLVINALEALPEEGGEILIRSFPGHALGAAAEDQGTWVVVQDNGKGMDDALREKALEPFFTTRKDGAGLGLAIVHKISRDHGGHMEIRSAPGKGTQVGLFFPAAPA